uniref:Reverse transcriptase domain-containing protein n=1 Tax=Cannabis sativa TaxID=3483 RepID=A0A803PI11_CANSA
MMNEQLQGSFKGEKGLLQGDPISSLLFVLIMDYLTRILGHYACKDGFGFHPLCKHLNLINLCFVHDLIIFFKGNEKPLRYIHEAFNPFYDSSGLKANMAKSSIKSGGVNDSCKRAILILV